MRILISFIIFIFLMSCAASKKVMPPAEKKNETSVAQTAKYDESFDPLSLEDNDIVIEKRAHQTASPKAPLKDVRTTFGNKETIPDSLLSYKEADGFRVQIFAGRNIEAATMAEAKAKEDFEKKGYKVYLIFEAPFYKLRVGDFTDRNDAENLRSLAKSLGYKSAFVVRSKVKVAQQ